MTPRGPIEIEWDDLPPDVQAQVPRGAKLGADSPLLKVRGARKGAMRHATGKDLEEALSLQHQEYALQRSAQIHRVHPPTIPQRSPNGKLYAIYRRRRPDDLACDYTGWVRFPSKPSWRKLNEAAPGIPTPSRRYDVLFDLKSWTDATYVHDLKQRAQLEELLAKRAPGVLTFLLLINRELTPNVGYFIIDSAQLALLRDGGAVLLREPIYAGEGSGKRAAGRADQFEHLVPHFFIPLLTSQSAHIDWLSRLETLVKEGK